MKGEKRKMLFKFVLGIVIGGLFGFLIYRFVGCKTGACPITRNPYISIMYGALMGALVAFGGR